MFRNVLCAVDLSPDTGRIVDWAAQFAAEFTARVFVVHVVRGFDSEDGPQIPDDWLSQTDREEIGRIKHRLGKDGQVLYAGGDIPEAVCSQAKKLHADLLVIGRSPKADDVGAARTTSFTIIRESPCPVASV